MNYSDPIRPTASATEDEGLLFAPVPAWERGKKRRGLGGMTAPKRVAETRTFEPTATSTTAATFRDDRATTTASTLAAEDAAFAAPIGRTGAAKTRKANSGVPGAAVVAGILAVAAIGGAGWYMSQDNEVGVAELTPGVAETSTTALATAPMAPPVAPPAAETRTTQVARAESARAPAPRATARSRTAVAAPSAAEQGVNASGAATLPAAPQPYSSLQGSTAGSQTTATAPAPTPPVTEAPVTATPPVSAEPVPVNPPATEASPMPTEEPTAADPT